MRRFLLPKKGQKEMMCCFFFQTFSNDFDMIYVALRHAFFPRVPDPLTKPTPVPCFLRSVRILMRRGVNFSNPTCVGATRILGGNAVNTLKPKQMALEVGYRVAIYTDYQLLHDRLNEFLRGNKPNSRWSNHDLWEILHDLTRTRNDLVTIHKVKAHNNWQLLEGEIRVQAWQNEQVDKAAKRTVHESPLFPKYLKITKILKEQELATMKYCDFLYSTAMDFFKTKRVKGEYREKFDVELLTVKGPGNKLPTDLTLLEELVTGETRFPVAFLEKIVKWSSLLSWGHDNMKNTIYDNIAWVELYIDFLISQQMHSPVKLPHHNPKKAGHFVLRTHPLGQHMTPCLGTDVYTFISAVKFLTRKHVISLPPTVAKATTSKLLGLSENYAGLNTRPRLVANLKAARWLQKTIIHQGAAHSSLNFVIGSMPE